MPGKKRTQSEVSNDDVAATEVAPVDTPKKVAKTAKVDTPKKSAVVVDGVVIAVRGAPEAQEAKIRSVVEAHAKVASFEAVQEHQQTGEILSGKKHITIVLSSDEDSARAACDALKAIRKSELGAPDLNPYVRKPFSEGTPSNTLVLRTEEAVTEEQVKNALPKSESVVVFPSYEWHLARVQFPSVEDAVLAKTNFGGSIGSVKVTHVSYQGENSKSGSGGRGGARGGRGGSRGGFRGGRGGASGGTRGGASGGSRGGFRGGRGGSRGGFRGGRGGNRGGSY